MAINSKQKGNAGERELAAYLRAHGIRARRGQQFSGTPDSPDVVTSIDHAYHFEVKRVEHGNLYKWMDQAISDAGVSQVPIVAHRKNRRDWLAILPLSALLRLIHERDRPLEEGPDNRPERPLQR